jgi:hypothetical protein
VFYYELREGDDDVFAELLLAREDEMNPESFFELVQSIRHRVQDTFTHGTLIEAIAEELEQDHEFIAISDERLTASVNVSTADADNFLGSLEPDEDDESDESEGADYRGIFVDFAGDGTRPN